MMQSCYWYVTMCYWYATTSMAKAKKINSSQRLDLLYLSNLNNTDYWLLLLTSSNYFFNYFVKKVINYIFLIN